MFRIHKQNINKHDKNVCFVLFMLLLQSFISGFL